MSPLKSAFLKSLIAKLTEELEILAKSAQAAHEAATHEESKAEDQYDTRGLESSYLAAAQAARGEELKKQIQYFSVSAESEHSLYELEDEEGERVLYLLARFGGGTKITASGKTALVITAESPIGSELVDKKTGDAIELMSRGQARELTIVSVE